MAGKMNSIWNVAKMKMRKLDYDIFGNAAKMKMKLDSDIFGNAAKMKMKLDSDIFGNTEKMNMKLHNLNLFQIWKDIRDIMTLRLRGVAKQLFEDEEVSLPVKISGAKATLVSQRKYHTRLDPPYRVLIDTNIFVYCAKYKLGLREEMGKCMHQQCYPFITNCVLLELGNLVKKYENHRHSLVFQEALKCADDIPVLSCWRGTCYDSRGLYADPCLIQRVKEEEFSILATSDRKVQEDIRAEGGRIMRPWPSPPLIPIKFIVDKKQWWR